MTKLSNNKINSKKQAKSTKKSSSVTSWLTSIGQRSVNTVAKVLIDAFYIPLPTISSSIKSIESDKTKELEQQEEAEIKREVQAISQNNETLSQTDGTVVEIIEETISNEFQPIEVY